LNDLKDCVKCSKPYDGDTFTLVVPVNREGKPLPNKYLCSNCYDEWDKVFHQIPHSVRRGNNNNFLFKWAKKWEQFLREKKEVVEFT
jgi:hypothetical protein